MRRREFIALVGGAAAAWPLAARAQEAGRTYRLGDLHLSPGTAPYNIALFDAVKAGGFIDGRNLIVDDAGFGLHVDQLGDHAAVVVMAQVDIIAAAGDPAVRAAQQATKSIPILGVAEDMVGSGFVASLAEPKGNTTGISLLSTELNGKRQENLIEALPTIKRMAVLADSNSIAPLTPGGRGEARKCCCVEHGIGRFGNEAYLAPRRADDLIEIAGQRGAAAKRP